MNQLQELLTSNNRHSSLDICRALRKIIVAALKEDLPEGLYPYETRVSDDIMRVTLNAKGEELFILQCRQSGKTEAVCISFLTLSIFFTKILKQHVRIGVFAPAASQSILVVKERLRRRYMRIKLLLDMLGLRLITGDSVYSELFVIRNIAENVDARIRCLSIGEKSNVTSETLNLIVIEQSEDVDPLKMTQEVFPMSAAVGGARILDGTPKNVVINSYFYDACTKREDRSNITRVDCYEASRWNKRYALFVENERERLGPESIGFRTQYELQWALGIDKFTTLETLQDMSRKQPLVVPMVDGKPVFNIYAGWDVAKQSDRSVITFGYGEGDMAHILEWMEFEGTDYPVQSQHVAQRCLELGARQICIDSAGVGDPVLDYFRKEWRNLPGGGARLDIQGIRTNEIREEDITSKLMLNCFRKKLIDFPSIDEAIARRQRRQRDRFIREFLDLNMLWKGNMLHLAAPEGYDKHDDYPKSCGLMLRSILKPPVKLAIRSVDF
jgi:hypothetical protein